MTRATVTAQVARSAVEEQRMCDPEPVMVTPSVFIEVTWPVGDHGPALAAFEDAVANIRRQIADAAEGASR